MNEKKLLSHSYEKFTASAASLLHNRVVVFLLLLSFSFFTSIKVSAQFCQTWSLAASTAQTANSGASTLGNTEIIGSGMSAPAYGTYQSFPKPGGVNWPGTVNTANGIYLEFPITPAAGNNLVITSITFSAYINNGSGTRLTANLYEGTTPVGVTADVNSTSAGTPTNVSMTGLSIPVANGTTAPIRLYITGNNSRTLNIQNIVICGTSTAAYCADATLGQGTAVTAGNIGNGTSNNILTNFTIGASAGLTLTNFSFPFTNSGLVVGDLVNYQFWYSATNSFASASVLSTVTTGLASSPISFGGFSQAINSGTAGYFWITANIAAGATAGHSITASALTPANLTFSGTPTTCGSAPAQGTKTITVLTLPTIITTPVGSITSTTATAGGNITNDGGSPITQSGVIYSTSPIIDTNSTTGGGIIYNAVNSIGIFSNSLTGLQPATTYYVVSFAVNAAGISYTTVQTFTTPPTPPRNCNGSGPLNGSAAKEGVFYLYGYAKAGEKIDWNVIRTDDNGAGIWTIDIYTPTGFYSTCTIGTTIGNQCTTAQITVTAATEGIWTLMATPAGNDGNDVVCPVLNVYTAGGTNLPGRVWTESLHGHDASTGVEPDFTLYFLTPSGYEYSATYSGLNGLNYTIVSDTLGVRTAPGSCTSAYQSVSYSGANPLLGPDNANCGKKNKIFFAPFDAGLPSSAPRFNIAAGSGQVIEPLINEPVVPQLSDVTFIRPNACTSVSTINFTVTNFTGNGIIYIDVNNNGSYTDPVDRIDTVLFVEGVNSIPFNGLDGLGNPIPSWQPITIKVAIEKIGETHFVQSDIEIFGGISVTRLNGPGAPDNTLYWNDTNLPVEDNCSVTPLLDGTGGINSSGGGVHDWSQCGTCNPPKATCGSTNNSTLNNGSWGNQRLIDNWTYITDSSLNRTLFINSFIDTTIANVCPSQLPYIWQGNSYTITGTYYDTLTSTIGCDSLVVLILTVDNCAFGSFASAPYIGTCSNNSVSSGFYNTTGTGVDLIGTNTFTGANLGTYIQNSNYLVLNGAEVKTYKTVTANVCGATMYYTIYLQGSRPANPVFTTVPLPFFDNCSGSTFPTGGPCSPGDQKWQKANLNLDLTTRVPGNYVIEVYYQVVGDDNSTSACTDTLYVNNSGNNYTAGFSIVAPPAISYTPSTFCTTVNAPQPVNLTAFPGGTFSAMPPGLNINSTTGSVTPSLSSPGTYTVKYVFDLGQNCPDSVTTTVTITPPPVIFAHGTNPSCEGICDGTATVDVVGGTTPYTYSWDNGGTTQTITNLCEGTYVVTVTDASNCAVSNSPVIQPGCFQIKSILVDACSPNEYDQEMVFFQVGQSPLTYTSLNVTWPTFTASGGVNDPWQGLCTNPTFISNVNATITGGGYLLPAPVSGILPAGANVVLITSNALNTSYNSFANLTDTLYVLFQCSNTVTNNVGHFGNNGASATRTLIMNFGAGCRDTVSYNPSQLININGTTGGSAAVNNGAYVNYTSNGVPGYFNYGCSIPYQTLTAEVTLVAPPKTEPTFSPVIPLCQNDAAPLLPTSSANTVPITGTWSPAVNTTTPGTTIYTFTPTAGQCADTATISITVKPVTTSTKDTAVCQNNLPYVWNGNNYSAAGTYKDTLTNSVGCDSILTLNLTIKNQTTSTTNISVCSANLPYNWNGTPYNAGGSYVFHTTNAAGCDSAATLNLTILNETTSITNISVCSANLPYNWNGTPYNTGGSYVFHTTNAAGCDSAATLNLTILNETTSITNVSVCAATLPYNWNGTPYNAAGSYVFHTTNAAGCDSAATLNLAILNETTSVTNISVCSASLPHNWNGTPYNAAGSYVFHTTNAAGCDSAATLNLTILNETTSTTNISVCSASLPYNWNGTPYNTGGSYVFHTTNAAGCDSAATLNLTILNETVSTTNVSVCTAALPYNWNGTPYNAAGSYVFHTTNAAGCDSAATLNLTILNETTSTTNVSVCAATLPYNWNGTPYNAGGSYVFHTMNAAGCDSAATLNLTILNETTSTTNISVCSASLPYNWNGTPYNAAGSYVFHTTNAAGCDSAATLNLTILNETTSTTNVSVCAATLPYNWNGTPYNTGGSYVFHTTNAAGCDSAATLNLTILNETTSTTNVSVCAATLPYNWNGTPYNSAGSYVFHTTNTAGCDSAATLNLTILNETTSITNISVCSANLPYNWNGTPYNAGGSYVFHTTNAAGCDSAATLNLTILNETVSTTNVSVCSANLPYNWNGTPYSAGGSYVFHTTNAAGCDSAATLNLTILNETTSITNVSVCAATLPYNWNGTPYNAAGSYVFHTTNAAGCDSAATLNLTILNETTSTTNVSVCAATLPYNWNGTPYSAGGSYVFHTTNAAGCDSAATLNLTVLNETVSATNVNVCSAALPYVWNGNSYGVAGSYVFHTTNAAGCDSAATLNLAILSETVSTTNTSVCATTLPYVWNGSSYNSAGSYVFHTTNAAGCDSAATLNLTVNPSVTSTTNLAICPAQLPYAWNGNSYTVAGAYSVTLISTTGCDSVATLNLSVNPAVTSTTDISICTAQLPYVWNGNSYNAAGSYSVTLTNVAGCDSIATLNLSVNPQVTSNTDITVCSSQLPYVWNGNSYNAAGSYAVTLTNVAGCDSIATLNLSVNPQVTSITNVVICNVQLPYSWNGNSYTAGGSYNITLISSTGCDSVATLNLTVNAETISTTNVSVCAAALPYVWNGNSFNSAGSYVFHTTNAAGCDSAATLNLAILNATASTTSTAICAAQLPYSWNGNSYTAAGTYAVTLINFAGCDSVATLNLSVNPAVTSVTDIAICNAQLPYVWNGNSYTAAGSYNVTLINIAGCDSVATLNLTVNNAVTSTTDISICNTQLPYSWNGNSYNAAGSYSVTLTNVAGCDSIAVLNLTVNNAVTSTTNISICQPQLPYTWNGNTYNAAGSYIVILVAANGCDSIATLNLTVNSTVTSTTDISVCPAQLPYSWNGQTYNAAGTYSITLVNIVGCDSVATLNLTVNSTVTSTTDVAICNTQLPYLWNGNNYNAAGSYSVTLVSTSGCDSVATLNLTINNTVTSTTDITICAAQLPYSWNSNSYNAAGSYNVTLVSATGCDSIATLNLTVNIASSSITGVSVCAAAMPYTWNGNNYSAAGSYAVTLVNSNGCDSVATLNLTVLNETVSTTNISVCAATLPYVWNGNSYNSAGSYIYHTINAAGCDSAATLNLIVNPAVSSNTDIIICPVQLPYVWNGNSYNAAGNYSVTLVSAAGCDSVATLTLSVNAIVTSTTDVTICTAQLPYIWNGNSYNAAGSYSVTLTNVAGCDSIATLNLTVNNTLTSTTDITICNAQLPYLWNGNNYNAAGSYNATLVAASGCDSIATLNLTVNNTTISTTDIAICNSQLPYTWNGNSYNAAGSYNVTLVNANGCDSIATLNLTVNNATASTTNIAICNTQLPYSWNGNSYNTAGSYSVTLLNANGCDSVATLNLIVNNTETSTTNITICPPQLPYVWNGNSYNSAGTYTVTLVSSVGCDSIATLNLAVNSIVTSITDITICTAQLPYSWNGNSYNAAGSYNITLINVAGCDSIATLNLTVNNAVSSTTDVIVCSTQLPYTWNGNNYNTPGSYNVTLVSSVGCDSIATLNLSINNTVTSSTNVTVCNTQLPYTWNGNSYNASGSYNVILVSSAGCDSVANLNLSVNNATSSITNVTICNTQLPYTWNGNTYGAAGSYNVTLVNVNGCDSIATLNLIVNNVVTSTTNITICPPQLPYTWNGNSYSTAGTYTVTLVSAAGCDSVASLNLTVNAVVTSTTDVIICNAQLPYSWNGNSYNAAGSYNVTLINVAGCDSIATLNLTVNNAVTSTTDVTICNTQLPYVWNGNSYNAGGSYNVTLAGTAGCDSIATLNLTVNNAVTSTTGITICSTQLPYVWNGNSYSATGSYNATLVAASGCDSIATLNLAVNNTAISTTDITICSTQLPYIWNGNSYNTAGSYNVTLAGSNSCDSVATLNLTVNNGVTSSTDINICPVQLPYIWNGNSYNSAGSYSVTLVAASGCDSIATLNLTVSAVVTSTTEVTICTAQLPYGWNGNSYNAAGSYSVTLINVAGCDSIATLNLTVNNTVTSTTDVTICNTQLPYTWNGNSYNAAGSYSVTLVSSGGCDSIATLNLTVNDAVTSITNIAICSTQLPYSWNGNSYTAAGSYNVTLVAVNGCDSVATLNLSVSNTATSTTDINICPAQLPYLWNGNSYTAAGAYSVTLVSSAGCDSIATLNLSVNTVVTSTTDVTICTAQLPYTWNGNTYNAAGFYNVTLTNVAGCDSIATLNLTVNNAVTSITNVAICNTQLPYTWNGNSYTAAGSYNVTLISSAGCDSVATLNLAVNNSTSSITNVTICNTLLPYSWNGNTYAAAGSYSVTLVNANGCDSIATLNLAVNNSVTSNTDVTICNAQLPYSWNGNSYNAGGSYNVTLTGASGCDSIATLNLTVNNSVTSTTDINICPVQLPYIWNGNSYNAAGSYTVTLISSTGCDSIAVLNLVVSTVVTSTTEVTICNAQLPYSWNGNTYNAAGSYSVTLTNIAGCDSVATLNLIVNSQVTSITNVAICNTQVPYTWNGNSYNAAGSYNVTLVSASGCDSIATLNLTVNNATASITNVAICSAQLPYLWNGTSYNAAGSYNITLVNALGCDSAATLNITVLNESISVTDISVCATALPYLWNGNNYSTAGSYIYHTTNAAGCDSAATLNLTILNATSSNAVVVNVCRNSLPYIWNGNSYTASGVYTYHTTNAAGCDSTATLNLTVNEITTSVTVVKICDAQLPYSWNGSFYTHAGTYTVTLISFAGCDSIATLELNSVSAVTQTTSLRGCDSVSFKGVTYTSSTVLQQTIPGSGGCDSVYIITQITVTNEPFDLKVGASPNPANEGEVINITTSSQTPYTVLSWEPADEFPSQQAISQQWVADSTLQILVTAKSSNGCLAKVAYLLNVKKPSDFWMPNAFTPNGDGTNDWFSAYGTTIKQGLLRIYNQWGQLLYETTDIKKGWDGKFKGVPQPVGVYAYVVFAEMYNGSKVTDKGFLNLIR